MEDTGDVEVKEHGWYGSNGYGTMNIVNDLWSFQFGIMGILVSIMTLLYASLCSKVEEMKVMGKSDDFTVMNRTTALGNSIASLRKLNSQVIKALVGSLVLFVFSTVLKYCIFCWLLTIDVVATLLLFTFCIYIAFRIYSQYQNETL